MQRNYTLDIMRIVACAAVVVCHSSGSLIAHGQVIPGTSWFNQCLGINAFTRWDVPFFVMLTGFFMLDPRRNVQVKTLFSKTSSASSAHSSSGRSSTASHSIAPSTPSASRKAISGTSA